VASLEEDIFGDGGGYSNREVVVSNDEVFGPIEDEDEL